MKTIMVIIICFGANCQAIWEKQWYPSLEDCFASSGVVRTYMMNTYPGSGGEIRCMTESEFTQYYNFLQNGGKPSLTITEEPSAS
jgi:hypothetical protein